MPAKDAIAKRIFLLYQKERVSIGEKIVLEYPANIRM